MKCAHNNKNNRLMSKITQMPNKLAQMSLVID